MSNRERIVVLTLVMGLISISIVGITVFTLYLTTAKLQNEGMMQSTENQARLLRSMAFYDPDLSVGQENKPLSPKILEHFNDAKEQFYGLTHTGEFLFARRDGDELVYLFDHRYPGYPQRVPIGAPEAHLMSLALAGKTGLARDKDYRGVQVFASYTFVPELGVGIVGKVDWTELRDPYLTAVLWAAVVCLILVFLGSVLFHRLAYPLVQQLEENELKYRTLFDSANEGILVISDVIEECNEQICRQLGYRKEEIVGRRISDFKPDIPPEASRKVDLRTRVRRAREGDPQYFYWHSRRKDGRVIDVDVTLKSVQIRNKPYILATLLDITDHRRAEIELRRAEKEVSEHREHLAHVSRLHTMGEMAAGIAHEINQPLAAINTYAQGCRRMLESGTGDADDMSQALERISVQALRAGEVIRRLRNFVNKRTTGRELIECNQLVRDVAKLAEVDARKYDLPIEMNLAIGIPPLSVDTVQIQQVILNLIRNGLEAMENYPRSDQGVRVQTERLGSDRVRIQVVDRGSGLSDEDFKQLFNPFYTTKETGMGLGLSISHTIISSHGGQLSAYNNDGAGATFEIVLPVAEQTVAV